MTVTVLLIPLKWTYGFDANNENYGTYGFEASPNGASQPDCVIAGQMHHLVNQSILLEKSLVNDIFAGSRISVGSTMRCLMHIGTNRLLVTLQESDYLKWTYVLNHGSRSPNIPLYSLRARQSDHRL